MPNNADKKTSITEAFDFIAASYNHTALRFFPFCADRLVRILEPKPSDKILDVATGTGVVAIAIAQAVKARGRVLAVDLSKNMLEQAEQSIQKMGLTNIDLFTMDAEALDFKNNYFDAVTCSFGLFFMPSMSTALTEWRRVTKPGGTVLFTSFTEDAFQPMVEDFIKDIVEFGVPMDESSMVARRLYDRDLCQGLMLESGYQDVEVKQIQVGYHLRDAEEWWQVLWNSGFRRYLMQLSAAQLPKFRQLHLERITKQVSQRGLWLDVSVWVTTGHA
ncbi:MAG: class I SAM-dependent methyltransferase [Thiohalomonadales bacterium]